MTEIKTAPSCSDPVESGALHVDVALQTMLEAVRGIHDTETIELAQAGGRILADNVHAPLNVPSHRNAAVDGFAIRGQDLPKTGEIKVLHVVGEAKAGHPYFGKIEADQAVRIMTGSAVPDDADTVIMQEHVERAGDQITLDARHTSGQNVRQAGEDIQQGECVLKSGATLTPPEIGLLASLGLSQVLVRRRLRVAVLSTGDELLAFDQPEQVGLIYDSNRFSLMAALRKLGCEVQDLGIIPDQQTALAECLESAAQHADVIFSSGGVSVGEADFTRDVLAQLGQVGFWKIAMKPGRPMAFGHIGQALFFGLPGNPVAVMVSYYQFAKPVLEKMMGCAEISQAPCFEVPTLSAIRKRPGRTEFQRGILQRDATGQWTVKTTGKQGSGILRSMCLANCMIILPHEASSVEIGDLVQVQPFHGLF